jgi:hypothetical protein
LCGRLHSPISPDTADKAHSNAGSVKGYIVYEPVVVVELTLRTTCVEIGQDGKTCSKQEIVCSAGAPFVLPNYSKPYLIDIKSGFGKAGVEVSFKDGWLLNSVKDSSDNTAVLTAVGKIFGLNLSSSAGSAKALTEDRKCKAPGLYRVVSSKDGIKLDPIQIY